MGKHAAQRGHLPVDRQIRRPRPAGSVGDCGLRGGAGGVADAPRAASPEAGLCFRSAGVRLIDGTHFDRMHHRHFFIPFTEKESVLSLRHRLFLLQQLFFS